MGRFRGLLWALSQWASAVVSALAQVGDATLDYAYFILYSNGQGIDQIET